jgi:rhodanese-related sulfurtransferase
MPAVTNAGGSLTSAVVLTLLAWGVRWVRSEITRRRKADSAREQDGGALGRFAAELSPAALRMLVETGPHPHLVFDVRPAGAAQPLPSELRGSLQLPIELVKQALASTASWSDIFQGVPYPASHFIMVFVGDTIEQQTRAAIVAASQGFQRTMTLAGALPGFSKGAAAQPHLQFLSRDAVALLLQSGTAGTFARSSYVPRTFVIDVRRTDERAMYGAIKGTVNVPGTFRKYTLQNTGRCDGFCICCDAVSSGFLFIVKQCVHQPLNAYSNRPSRSFIAFQQRSHAASSLHAVDLLPSALAMSPEAFADRFRFPKPVPEDVIIMTCRTSTRSAWAAQLAQDAGLRCLVHRQGVYGWRLDSSVKAYRGYKVGDAPPEPETFQVEEPDAAAGAAELHALGLGPLLPGMGGSMTRW